MTQGMQISREVREETGEQDRIAEVQLQARLRRQFGFAAQEIRCRCSAGVLLLEGHVDSFYQRHLAQELARSVAGINSVINRLVFETSRISNGVNETFCSASDRGCS
jgi:osmotically-inducible protein OsmY